MTTELTTAHHAPVTARRMTEAALRFLDSLTDEQRGVATFDFQGDERYEWNYVPVDREGLRLKDMNSSQRALAFELMASGLSVRSADQARQIIDLESILNVWERMQNVATHWRRDPELYYYSVFGDPSGPEPWAWRAGGHHIGLHFTVIDREVVSPLPFFLGANPAEVRHGPEKGKRILSQEEDLGQGGSWQSGLWLEEAGDCRSGRAGRHPHEELPHGVTGNAAKGLGVFEDVGRST